MSNDIDIKKILEDFSKMKTKFFMDPPKIGVDKEFLKEDRKRLLMESPQETPPIEKRQIKITIPIKQANSNLKSVKNCLTGERIVSPNITPRIGFKVEGISQFFEKEKRIRDQKGKNYISACEYYYDAKLAIINSASKSVTNLQSSTLLEDWANKNDRNMFIINCLQLCWQNQNLFEDGCVENFEYSVPTDRGYEQRKVMGPGTPISKGIPQEILLTHPDFWFLYTKWYNSVKSELDLYLKGSVTDFKKQMPKFFNSLKQVSPPWTYSEPNDWNYYNNSGTTSVPFNFDEINSKSQIEGSFYGKGPTKEKFYNLLPLTREEMNKMESENKYNSSDELKLGKGTYLCKRQDKQVVNLWSSRAQDEDEGAFDFEDTWVAWISSDIVGKFIDDNSKFNQLLMSDGRIPNGDGGFYGYEMVKVKLFEPVTDEKDTKKTYSEVYVSWKDVEFCKMKNNNTQVEGTDFERQILKTVPMAPFKNPSSTNPSWAKEINFNRELQSNSSMIDHMPGQ